jgi:hypothetical protein
MLADELAGMREAIGSLLPDTCYILAGTVTPDGFGGSTQSWGTASTVDCRLDMQDGSEQLAGGAIQPFIRYMLSLPYDAVITESNRVSVNGLTFTVTSVNAGQSWSAVKRAVLEKV